MRLGLLGGSFDPVHFGHLILAEYCRQQCGLDAVWFLPTAVPPHKQDVRLTPAEHRVAMLELAVAGNPAFSVCRYEVDRGGVCYTVDTLEHFCREQPDRELFFLVGADMLADLPHWRNAARVCELATPVAVRRPGCAMDFEAIRAIASPERVEAIRRCQVEMPEIGISSTDIRRRVEGGRSIRYLTPHAVEMYIETHGLYKKMPPV
ncbi:MAG: nicotinate-nucleotide adenylyltransferase [Thermoguttaceae bacterium]